ncbi:MAG: hypothetical protein XD72_0515 [Methanothrix harundinacea]|jgi:hypothetical protein|uniref:Uncharacterized protein n=1 Tax=Methanothrix harundinacea TaxID=301375 RepID=A0A101ILI4_9EURY|nr:MAG: hypothetical protein XD72_0515 [Methanothrix harundinacea]KUK97412.1 MAG: hypothetical protein XE07_0242 [Methanothrix harundinacea]
MAFEGILMALLFAGIVVSITLDIYRDIIELIKN